MHFCTVVALKQIIINCKLQMMLSLIRHHILCTLDSNHEIYWYTQFYTKNLQGSKIELDGTVPNLLQLKECSWWSADTFMLWKARKLLKQLTFVPWLAGEGLQLSAGGAQRRHWGHQVGTLLLLFFDEWPTTPPQGSRVVGPDSHISFSPVPLPVG